jgi:hypothetical protein
VEFPNGLSIEDAALVTAVSPYIRGQRELEAGFCSWQRIKTSSFVLLSATTEKRVHQRHDFTIHTPPECLMPRKIAEKPSEVWCVRILKNPAAKTHG